MIKKTRKEQIKPSNMYTVLMDEGVKNEEKEMGEITKKRPQKR